MFEVVFIYYSDVKGVKCITPLAYMLLISSKIRNDYEVDDDDEDGRHSALTQVVFLLKFN